MINYWTKRARAIIEKEVLLAKIKDHYKMQMWYNKMPGKVSAIFSSIKTKTPDPSDLDYPIGIVHHIKMMKLGIEGVLQAPKNFHKYPLYLLYYPAYKKEEPFWVVLHDGTIKLDE